MKKYVTLNLTRDCNLNCKKCNQVLSKSEPLHLTKDQYTVISKSIKEINPRSIGLTGGEPLLHKDFTWFVDEIKRDFPNTDLFLITNALLLGRLNQSYIDKFTKIAMSWYKGVNEKIIKQYLEKPNMYTVDSNHFHEPNVTNKNGKLISILLALMCPMKRLFIIGQNAYPCCLAEVTERIHHVKGIHVDLAEKNWIKKFNKIKIYKACLYCSFTKLNQSNPKRLIKTFIQKVKIKLISNNFIYSIFNKSFNIRKARLIPDEFKN